MALHVPRAPGFSSMMKDGARFFSGLEEAVIRNIGKSITFKVNYFLDPRKYFTNIRMVSVQIRPCHSNIIFQMHAKNSLPPFHLPTGPME